ncbi:MAG: hypothetical protein ACLPH3_20340 [Terracidiphilus sp.]
MAGLLHEDELGSAVHRSVEAGYRCSANEEVSELNIIVGGTAVKRAGRLSLVDDTIDFLLVQISENLIGGHAGPHHSPAVDTRIDGSLGEKLKTVVLSR